ncbi:MAG: hypothetical protein K0R60_9 [Microbacterium sp.]|jgi:hypothetical protein|nr:hypothetical protein [Microbacterium sp.]
MERRIDWGLVAMCAVACGAGALFSASWLGILDMWEAWMFVVLSTFGGVVVGSMVEIVRMRYSLGKHNRPDQGDQ